MEVYLCTECAGTLGVQKEGDVCLDCQLDKRTIDPHQYAARMVELGLASNQVEVLNKLFEQLWAGTATVV